MAFKEFIFTPTKQPGRNTGVKASLRKMGRGITVAKLVLNLSTQRAAEMGFAKDDKLQVMLGDGEHAGLVRVRKNNSAAGAFQVAHKNSQKGDWYEVNLGPVPGFPERPEKPLWCDIEKIGEGWFEIKLPSWARPAGLGSVASVSAVPRTERVANPQTQAMAQKLAVQRAAQIAPAPNFSGKDKPSRKENLERIGKIGATP